MGEDIAGTAYTREQRQRYREKVRLNLDTFEQMLTQSNFDGDRLLTGLEIELNLVDGDYQPSMNNAEVLKRIADPAFQTELGQYTIELNVNPRPMPGDAALQLEDDLRKSLNRAESLAGETGAHIVMIGILPTIMAEHLNHDWMSANARYSALNKAVIDARGEDIPIDIEGGSGERLAMFTDSIGPESACTSVQLHLQVTPQEFAAHWNAAQAVSALQVALGRLGQSEVDLAVRNLRGSFDVQREQLGEVELGLKELRLELTHLTQDIRERQDAELALVLADHHDRPIAGPEEVERQKELKRVLARMGEVNLTAIEEFEEVASRVDYLSTQKNDLETAIAQLQEAIDKINKTTRERFVDTFKSVNEMFQQVFPRLFSGGKAELKLTDPGDMLGTGVEIVAQPPGKQVRSLELLSGGEKALTAVSLIFAIFLIKPSPFCLLDEVDAPLDEANVGRFGAMVAEMSENTQFIIITHNKRTMEIADRLYGVTMEVKGVSKLVSVNIRRAVEMAVA